MTFCAREKEDGANFFGERSVGGGGSLTRRKKDRFARRVVRRCDDAFCWNAPNKLSFFFASSMGFFLSCKERKKEKALVLVAHSGELFP